MGQNTIFDSYGKRIFLAIGNTGDEMIGADLAVMSFESFLTHHLREAGFYNILFFNSREIKGQYTLDEDSANRLIYQKEEKKKEKKETGRKKSVPGARRRDAAAEKPEQAGGTDKKKSPPQEEAPGTEIPAEEKWRTLTYGYGGVEMKLFREKIYEQLSSTEHKNAVVFSNVDALLENPQELDKIFSDINRMLNSQGIVICIAQDYTEKGFLDMVSRYSFFEKFFTNGEGELLQENILRLGNPGQDEYERLLEHMRIVGIHRSTLFGSDRSLRLTYDVRKLKELAGLLQFYATDERKEGYVRLREVRVRLENYMIKAWEQEKQKGKIPFDEESISVIYGGKKSKPKTAMEELNRRGWETVYEAINKLFVDNLTRDLYAEKKTEEKSGFTEGGAIYSCERMQKKVENINKVAIPHFMLLGPPGTGKTTIAKLIGRALHEAGILKSGHTVERRAGTLIADHVGGSGKATINAINAAKDGVLFIDEAYALVSKQDNTGEHARDFGQAVVDTLVSCTERQNQEEMPFCLVLAGYRDDLKKILDMNPGLDGRIPKECRLELKPYSPDHLADIFMEHVKAAHYSVPEEIRDALTGYFTEIKDSKTENRFQNAREAVNEAERVIRNCSYRRSGNREIQREDFGKKARFLRLKSENLEEEKRQIEDEFNQLLDTRVGNQALKDVLIGLKDHIIYNMYYPQNRETVIPGYYFFEGAPGTGKTTSVRLFAKCLETLGIFESPEVQETTASDLIKGYEGQTAINTRELLEQSCEKVLLIDEAYALDPNGRGHGGGSYNQQAVDEIVAFLDKPENKMHCCIIFAGYQDEMEKMKKANPGWPSRITDTIVFPSYSGEECVDIMESMAGASQYELDDDVRTYYTELLERLKTEEHFSNGRTVRNVLDKMKKKARARALKEAYAEDDPRLLRLTMEDVLTEEEVRKSFE